jgi:hypothetical protein
VLASCSEGSLLTPELTEDEEISIRTVDDGTMLSAADTVSISVQHRSVGPSDPEPLDYMDVELRDGEGILVADTRIEGQELETDSIPPLELERLDGSAYFGDLEPGNYTISFAVFRNGEEVASRERTLFVVEDPEDYAISGIATYPPSLAPGRTGVAQATITAPGDCDCWLQWTFENDLIHEGTLSEGADQITLEAPSESGAYTLGLGLFPNGPPPADYEGPAPIRQQTRVIVRAGGGSADRALGPAEAYFSLFHFDGSTEDSGVGGELTGGRSVDAEPIGETKLRVSDRLFGYELDGTSGFEVSGLILPFQGDALSRFSLNLRLRADELSGTHRILSLEASDSALSLALTVDEEGRPTLELSSADTTSRSSPRSPIFEVGEPLDLSIAVIPGPTETLVKWYANGEYVSESLLQVDFAEADPEAEWHRVPGVSRIAGENGFVGIVDEFGVYFRNAEGEPAVYTDMYHDARRRELGSTLAYAEGFDAELPLDGIRTRGNARTEQGILILGSAATAELPSLQFESDVMMIEMAVPEVDASGVPVLEFEHRGDFLFSADVDGEFADHTGEMATFPVGSTLRIRIARASEELTVWVGSSSRVVPVPSGFIEEIDWRVANAGSTGDTARIESLLAYHEAERFSARSEAEETDALDEWPAEEEAEEETESSDAAVTDDATGTQPQEGSESSEGAQDGDAAADTEDTSDTEEAFSDGAEAETPAADEEEPALDPSQPVEDESASDEVESDPSDIDDGMMSSEPSEPSEPSEHGSSEGTGFEPDTSTAPVQEPEANTETEGATSEGEVSE